MTTPSPPPSKQSHFEDSIRLIEQTPIPIGAEHTKDLVACFLTITKFRDLLFAITTHLGREITTTFLENTMIEDFNRIIIQLRDYSGQDETGVRAAADRMQEALFSLYIVDATLADDDKKNTLEYVKERLGALLACRAQLQLAFEQLEHLANYLPPESNAGE